MELGFYCNRQAINSEYLMDFQIAFRYHKRALEIWKSLNQQGYIIMCLRRLIGIASTLKSDQKQFQSLLRQQIELLNLPEDITIDVFFKDYDKKVACFRNVAASLRRLESAIPISLGADRSLYFTAIKVRLSRAKIYALKTGQLLAVEQLKRSISTLDKQTIINREFARESISQLNTIIRIFIAKIKKIAIKPFISSVYGEKIIPKKSFESISQVDYELHQQSKNQLFEILGHFDKSYTQIEKQISLRSEDFSNISRITFKYKDQTNQLSQIPESQYPKSEMNLEEYKLVNNLKGEYSFIYEQAPTYQSNRAAFQDSLPTSQRQENNEAAFNQQQTIIGDPAKQIPKNNTVSKSEVIPKETHQNNIKIQGSLSITKPQTQVMSVSSHRQSFPTKPSSSYIKSTINKPMKIVISQQLLINAKQTCLLGDYLIKYNLNSNNKRSRFFQVSKGELKWADKDSQINDLGRMESYPLCEIRGIIFGRCTNTLLRHKSLKPWRCLSIMTLNRSMDLYFEEIQINPWVIHLSNEIKQHNHQARVPMYSKVLWQKLKLRIIDRINSKKALKLSFVKLLCMYKKIL